MYRKDLNLFLNLMYIYIFKYLFIYFIHFQWYIPNSLTELQNIAAKRLEISKKIFENTSFEYYLYFEGQRQCLITLESYSKMWSRKTVKELKKAIDDYLSATASWRDKYRAFLSIEYYVLGLSKPHTSLFASDNFKVCQWPSGEIKGPDKQLAMLKVYLNAATNSFEDINEPSTLRELSETAKDAFINFQREFLKISEILKKFLESEMPKSELVDFILNSEVIQNVVNLIKADHYSLLKLLENYVQKVCCF